MQTKGRPLMYNLASDQYGNWKVVEKIDNRFAKVRCTCGKLATRRIECLVKGQSKSCGCKKGLDIPRDVILEALNLHDTIEKAGDALFLSKASFLHHRKKHNIRKEGGRYV